ncbi:MAG: hypothetical protein H7Y38_02995, partial [Armatimonadetes bacterium]|nr:hypothetical protein [Armatimonadota bacterium]
LFGIGTVICAALAGMFPRPASAIELLTNGNFETDPGSGFAPGWTRFEQTGSVGQFYLDTPGSTVFSANELGTPQTTEGGARYAVSVAANATGTQSGAGAHSLSQSFSLPGNATSVTLRYQFFAQNYRQLGTAGGEAGLDYTRGTPDGNGGFINMHARVDILRDGALPLSTNASDIIRTVEAPFSRAANGSVWEVKQLDVTSGLQFGQTYTLRFGVVKNVDELLLGVDNVSLDYVGTVVIPETNTAGLMWLPMLLMGGMGLLRRYKAQPRTP